MTSQTVFAPSPKPETNGKKLADVPEEDSHCEDADETDGAEEASEEATEPLSAPSPNEAEVPDDVPEIPDPVDEDSKKTETTEVPSSPLTTNVTVEINSQEDEITETTISEENDNSEQKSEL